MPPRCPRGRAPAPRRTSCSPRAARAKAGLRSSRSFLVPRGAGGPASRPAPILLVYWIPAALHAAAYADVQICDTVKKLSFTTVSLMLLLVTDTGVRITEG